MKFETETRWQCELLCKSVTEFCKFHRKEHTCEVSTVKKEIKAEIKPIESKLQRLVRWLSD